MLFLVVKSVVLLSSSISFLINFDFLNFCENCLDVHEIKLRDAVRKARAETEDENKEKVIFVILCFL